MIDQTLAGYIDEQRELAISWLIYET